MQQSRAKLVITTLAVISLLGARALRHWAFGDLAHVMDEIAYVFQAKLFATGHVLAPLAEPRAAFNTWFIEDRATRYSIFPPGWPALLGLGFLLHLQNWVNPLLHGATVLLVGRAGDRVGGPRVAMLVALLYAASPQAVVLAASFMSHTVVSLVASVMLLLVIAVLQKQTPTRGLLLASGLGLGVVAATRPVCATLLAFSLVVAVGFARAWQPKPLVTMGAWIALGALPFTLGLLWFNRITTGSAWLFPQTVYFDTHLPPANFPYFHFGKGCNALGIGPSHGCDLTAGPRNHDIAHAWDNTSDNLEVWFLLAAGPVLAIAPVLALISAKTRRFATYLLILPIATILIYALYWQGGTCLGARFYQVALPSALLLVALAIDFEDRRRIAVVLAFTLGWNVLAYVHITRELTDPTWGYWGVDDRFDRLRRDWKDGNAVVMMAFGGDDIHNPDIGWTAAGPAGGMWMLNTRAEGGLAQNEPVLDDTKVIFAKFHPALVPELQARFPGRSFWLYVTNGDRSKDTLETWESVKDNPKLDPKAYRHPVDNFDAWRTAPAELPPPFFFVAEPD